jgi:ribokinase
VRIPSLSTQTAQSIILYDADGKRTVLTDLKDVTDMSYPIDHFASAIRNSNHVVLTNIAYSKPFLPLVQSYQKPIATDLHTLTDLHDAYNAPFLHSANILFMSGELLPATPETWASAVLATYPAEIVVIGLGSQGAQLAVRHSTINTRFPAVTTRAIVQTGGAGDALFAAFLVRRNKSKLHHCSLLPRIIETYMRLS